MPHCVYLTNQTLFIMVLEKKALSYLFSTVLDAGFNQRVAQEVALDAASLCLIALG